MNIKEATARAEELRALLNEHDYNYHVLDKPKISDFEYDKLFAELTEIETEFPKLRTADSPTYKVGGMPLELFAKGQHTKPMLSLQNSYSSEDLMLFDERVKKHLGIKNAIPYFCEPKFDGLAIEIIYENGILSRALTRGDGVTGEVVTENVRTIKTLPLKLRTSQPPKLLEVRGEVLIFKNDFVRMNAEQQEAGHQPFANPRNAAAGSIRQLDSRIAASRPLKIFCYSVGSVTGLSFNHQCDLVKTLSDFGLPTSPHINLAQDVTEAISFYQKIQTERHSLAYDIDGIVVKVNDIHLQEQMGQIAKSPRWATAVKYPPEQAQTVVKNILVQVGRTGALTPVAVMNPVLVGGVTITHATLHNQDEINRKDIRIGDTVLIQRAGDVIPEIVEVVTSKRSPDAREFVIPSECPVCGSLAKKVEDEVVLRCSNTLCPAVVAESLKHFVSRRAMNIDKVGDKIVEQLMQAGLVRSFSDFYKLNRDDLLKLERQGEKSVQNVLDSIERSKRVSLARFIYALGIRHLGEQTAKLIAQHYRSLEHFLKVQEAELNNIDGIGDKMAASICSAMQNQNLREDIENMIELGVSVEELSTRDSSSLEGLTIVITGSFTTPRDEIKQIVEANGGKTSNSVSKKTSYLLAGADAGSKLEKALELTIPVLTWEEFEALLNGKN